MSIFANGHTRLLVQGITGREGSFHARQMLEYGTQVVAGVTPGKGGQTFEGKVPVFNTVADAVRETGANASVIYVPPMAAAAAVIEAADATVRVPQRGRAESLNLAAAATVCLFECARRSGGGGEASLQAMIGAAAHDLRSPLTALKGFGYALEKRWDHLRARAAVDKMRDLRLSPHLSIVQPVDARPAAKPSLYSRVFFRFIDWLRQRIAQASLVGDKPIFHNSQFPWLATLEARAPAIRAELTGLLAERSKLPAFHEISPDVGMITSDDQW